MATPPHPGLLLSLQAPAEGEAKEEVGAASSMLVPLPPRTWVALHINYEAPHALCMACSPQGWVWGACAHPFTCHLRWVLGVPAAASGSTGSSRNMSPLASGSVTRVFMAPLL